MLKTNPFKLFRSRYVSQKKGGIFADSSLFQFIA